MARPEMDARTVGSKPLSQTWDQLFYLQMEGPQDWSLGGSGADWPTARTGRGQRRLSHPELRCPLWSQCGQDKVFCCQKWPKGVCDVIPAPLWLLSETAGLCLTLYGQIKSGWCLLLSITSQSHMFAMPALNLFIAHHVSAQQEASWHSLLRGWLISVLKTLGRLCIEEDICFFRNLKFQLCWTERT